VVREYLPGISFTQENSTYYYHHNHLGTVRFLTDSEGEILQTYDYDAFGNLLTSEITLTQPYRYVGKHAYYTDDTTGLLLLGARWYDPEVGRFLSRDVMKRKLLPLVNLYLYGENNPLRLIDPTGMETKEECLEKAKNWLKLCFKKAEDYWKKQLERSQKPQ